MNALLVLISFRNNGLGPELETMSINLNKKRKCLAGKPAVQFLRTFVSHMLEDFTDKFGTDEEKCSDFKTVWTRNLEEELSLFTQG